ncbi:carbon-nitrogen hydrolase family protein [Brachybacterium subflavum]|uniref:carbon-nitrogen hydrolase family protein n=1 Tax=Brachybacterium subflavum TaxID=2585206 RepID=UPI00187A1098|nr:carbon-nitrogen hydrolase family protein [Brachybacterium subflavum]
MHSDITADPQIRLAVAQTTPRHDPFDIEGFEAAAREIRELMRRARSGGADIIQFPEAALCFPDKRSLSNRAPDLGEADWSAYPWDALNTALAGIRSAARQLALSVVIGAQTRNEAGRPSTSILAIDEHGRDVVRYDERRLSRSKAAYLYEQGDRPATFTKNGVTFGIASGLEVLFEDIFVGYEDLGVDVVLFSTQGPGDPAEAETLSSSARVAARHQGFAIGYSVPTSNAPVSPAGIISATGGWIATCDREERPDLVISSVGARPENGARDWRRSMIGAN